MKLEHLNTIDQMEDFINGTQAIAFAVSASKKERYRLVESILTWFNYSCLRRFEKGIAIRFLI